MPSQTNSEELQESGSARGRANQRRGQRLTLTLALTVTALWAIYVLTFGHVDRVLANWESSATMIFGSFVAGASPQGGGVVAFPVFTKVLGVAPPVARVFSLAIQSVGMTAASLSILFYRRAVAWKAIAWITPPAAVGFVVAVFWLSDGTRPFRPSLLPGPYVKVVFTIVLAAMAAGLWVQYRSSILEHRATIDTRGTRARVLLCLFGVLGGLASALVGSGADVFAYVVIVLLAGLSPRTGVPTSVIIMTLISVLGLAILVLFDGQLAIELSGNAVSRVSSQAVAVDHGGAIAFAETGSPVPLTFDAFGLWLAATPVVVWGAPLGAWVSAKLPDRMLIRFIVGLAAAEVVSTVLFLPPLHTDQRLQVFTVGLTAAMFGGGWFLLGKRHLLIGQSRFDVSRPVATPECRRLS